MQTTAKKGLSPTKNDEIVRIFGGQVAKKGFVLQTTAKKVPSPTKNSEIAPVFVGQVAKKAFVLQTTAKKGFSPTKNSEIVCIFVGQHAKKGFVLQTMAKKGPSPTNNGEKVMKNDDIATIIDGKCRVMAKITKNYEKDSGISRKREDVVQNRHLMDSEGATLFEIAVERELKAIENLRSGFDGIDEKYFQGTLHRRSRKSGTYYVHEVVKGSRPNQIIERKELGGGESAEVREFVKARYFKELNRRLAQNERAIIKMKKSLEEYSFEAIVESMRPAYQELLRSAEWQAFSTKSKNDWQRAWMEEYYDKNPMQMERPHKTITGEAVRSKGEVLIYNMLTSLDVPFRYECALTLNLNGIKKVVYPDFTILCGDGSLMFIEYSGMLNSENYFASMIEKARAMYKAGIVLNRELLLVFDDVDGSIDMEMISDVITRMVLPKVSKE